LTLEQAEKILYPNSRQPWELPVARLELDGDEKNIALAFDREGYHIGSIGYRPWDSKLEDQGFLFSC